MSGGRISATRVSPNVGLIVSRHASRFPLCRRRLPNAGKVVPVSLNEIGHRRCGLHHRALGQTIERSFCRGIPASLRPCQSRLKLVGPAKGDAAMLPADAASERTRSSSHSVLRAARSLPARCPICSIRARAAAACGGRNCHQEVLCAQPFDVWGPYGIRPHANSPRNPRKYRHLRGPGGIQEHPLCRAP